MGVYAGVGMMSPAIAVSVVPILVALGGGVANLVTGAATHLGLLIVGAVGADMTHVATYEAEVVHVDD